MDNTTNQNNIGDNSDKVLVAGIDLSKDNQSDVMVKNSHKRATKADHLKEYRWKQGESGNPGGRPKDTLKEYQARKYREMSEEEKDKVLENMTDDLKWRMAEGNPHQTSNTDLTSGGKAVPFMTLDELRKNNSDNKDSESDKKD